MKPETLPVNLTHSWIKYGALSLSLLSFTVPFCLGGPQFLVGIIINTALFASVIFLPNKYFWPIIVLPSLAVLSRGIIFGPLTPFLIYFLPFIWLGNFGLIYIFKKTYQNSGFLKAMFLAGAGKQILLILSAQIFFNFKIVPSVFLATMGINQLLTAIAGGLIAYFLFHKFIYGAKKS
ncbi:MAG: hypothetical protein V1808_03720 [Candidatus Daviesbacteria bacterium]